MDDGIIVSRHVDAEKPVTVNDSVVLINSIMSPTITNKMLSTCSNFVPTEAISFKLEIQNAIGIKQTFCLQVREKGRCFAKIKQRSMTRGRRRRIRRCPRLKTKQETKDLIPDY